MTTLNAQAEAWRVNALLSLADAKAEIETATEPMVIVICTVHEADLLKERAVSIYHNQTQAWTRRLFAFVAWRTSLWDDGEP